MFNENFGESLAQQWRPGMSVSGSLVRNGKRVNIMIQPDGTTEEREEEVGSQGAGYSYVSSSGGGGGSHTSIQIQGSIGQAFAGYVVPPAVQEIPRLGPAVVSAVSWVPMLACGVCCYSWCC